MPINLLAVCKAGDGLTVKRVRVSADVQALLEGIFLQQEQDFHNGITEEIPFDGGWKPEPNELLTLPITDEIQQTFMAAQREAVDFDVLDANRFLDENVRALGVVVTREGAPRLLLQQFDSRQILQRRLSLTLSGDTFNQLTAPTFCLATALSGVVEGDKVKFRSFSKIRLIFQLKHLYIEATDAQVDAFSGHELLSVANRDEFRTHADQGVRKLIHAISHQGILDEHTAADISGAAAGEGLRIEIEDDKIIVPRERKSLKELLAFLDDGYYRAALSGLHYITNSKRRTGR